MNMAIPQHWDRSWCWHCDGTNVNHTLVKEGWRWWYRKYAQNLKLQG
jgi:endonuclease YncB( thermonuclease family)